MFAQEKIITPEKFVSTSIEAIKKPFTTDKNFWLKTSLVSGTVVVSSFLDRPIKTFSQKNKSPFLNHVSDFAESFGNAYGTTGISLGLVFAGFLRKDNYQTNTGIQSFQALAGTSVLVFSFKSAFGRERPTKTNDNYNFKGIGFHNHKNTSFLSGHSAASWSVLTVVAERYYKNTVVKITSYGIAATVSLSRIYQNKHWLSDVVAGSFLGYFIGKMVVKINKDPKFSFTPFLSEKQSVLLVSYSF
ncbi:phosphatase PAP2 family protein [bacterium]|nr:phosphatase PAP2 family protein [bacterium]